MPRRPRIVIPQMPLHVIQRGNNRQACFFADEDYRRYLDWLREYAGELGCDIHAYVLTTNHVHLLLTPREADSVGRLMKRLGQRLYSMSIASTNAAVRCGKAGSNPV